MMDVFILPFFSSRKQSEKDPFHSLSLLHLKPGNENTALCVLQGQRAGIRVGHSGIWRLEREKEKQNAECL